MGLCLVEPITYSGQAGVQQVRLLQSELNDALKAENWGQVRRLDRMSAHLIDRVILANESNPQVILVALKELKGIYASLVMQCNKKVASMVN